MFLLNFGDPYQSEDTPSLGNILGLRSVLVVLENDFLTTPGAAAS